MPSVSESLLKATEILKNSGLAEARRDAASLLGYSLCRDRAYLIAHSDRILTEEENSRFLRLVERRASREPLQYITGKQEFYELEFTVTPDVLIPRPETELIVENAIEFLRGRDEPRFCEVGVGSGCIAVSVLHNSSHAFALGLDISAKALAVARKNAEKHGVSARLTLVQLDVFSVLKGGDFDLIVSNPPYIPAADIEKLQSEVRDHEPLNALTDGADGLSLIRRIVAESPAHLKPGGQLLMEIGYSQSEAVEALFDRTVWPELDIIPDLQGIPRMVKGIAG